MSESFEEYVPPRPVPDFETARNELVRWYPPDSMERKKLELGFDLAVNMANPELKHLREVVAEKDAEIARLEARMTAIEKEHRRAHGANMCAECGHDFPCVTVTMLRNTLK